MQLEGPSGIDQRDAERRRVVVMMTDMVGSTELASALDVEDFEALTSQYRAWVTEVVTAYGGSIAQHRGDGVIAVFGHPLARHDMALRAVAAALALQSKAKEQTTIAIRTGLDQGEVLIAQGSSAEGDWDITGIPAHVASRLQEHSPVGGVLLSSAVLQAAGEDLYAEDLGERSFKGLEQPVRVYRAKGLQSQRLDVQDDIPLFGRTAELDELAAAWMNVLSREHGAVGSIQGEAGAGKSRLIREWSRDPRVRKHIIGVTCHALYRQRFMGLIQALLRTSPMLRIQTQVDSEDLAALKGLLNPRHSSTEAKNESPEALYALAVAVLRKLLCLLGQQGPLCLVIDNLHWADDASVQLLVKALNPVPPGLLVLLAWRTDEAALSNMSTTFDIELKALPPSDSEALLDAVLLSSQSTTTQRSYEAMLAAGAGLPLHLEQLAFAVPQAANIATEHGSELSIIPQSLGATLLQRLDYLGSERQVALTAAVLGERFSRDDLQALTDLGPAQLQDALNKLVEQRIISRVSQTTTYVFRHGLLQRVAYDVIPKKRRRSLHARIAARMSSTAVEPAEYAYHLAAAGDYKQAARYYNQAGNRAALASSHSDAVEHFQRSISCYVEADGLTPEKELELKLSLASSMLAVKFYTDPELNATWERVQQLARTSDNVHLEVFATYNAGMYRQMKSDWRGCLSLMDRLDEIAQSQKATYIALMANLGRVLALVNLGEYARAHRHALAARSHYVPSDRVLFLRYNGSDLGIASLAWCAMTAAAQCDDAVWERALREAQEELVLHDHPFTKIYCLGVLAHSCLHRFEFTRGHQFASEGMALAKRMHLPGMDAYLSIFAYSLAPSMSQVSAQRAKLALEQIEAIGSPAGIAAYWAVLASKAWRAGHFDTDVALELLARADANAATHTPGATPLVDYIAAKAGFLCERQSQLRLRRALSNAQKYGHASILREAASGR